MNGDYGTEATPRFDEVRELLNRARQIDPTSREEAVRGYVREIAEAEAMLDTMESGGAPLVACFSASWPVGYER